MTRPRFAYDNTLRLRIAWANGREERVYETFGTQSDSGVWVLENGREILYPWHVIAFVEYVTDKPEPEPPPKPCGVPCPGASFFCDAVPDHTYWMHRHLVTNLGGDPLTTVYWVGE